jgi:hypothetical protein
MKVTVKKEQSLIFSLSILGILSRKSFSGLNSKVLTVLKRKKY